MNKIETATKLKLVLEEQKSEFAKLFRKYKEVSAKTTRSTSKSPLSSTKTPIIGTRSELENLNKQNRIYEKEKKIIKSRMSFLKEDYELQIANKNSELKQKLNTLIKENKRLEKSPNRPVQSHPVTSNSTDSLFQEITYQRSKIRSIERAMDETKEKIKNCSEKFSALEKNHEKLLRKISTFQSNNKFSQTFHELDKKLKAVQNAYKSSVVKLENIIKEKESEQKNLEAEQTRLNTKLFKQDQQKRLLEINQADYFMMKNNNGQGKLLDSFNPDVSFLYKPSIKALYNT